MQRFPTLPKVSELLKLYNLRARSQLSQNFLLDLNITNRIVAAAGGIKDKHVCEVGPGPGSLTRSILIQDPKRVVAVEKDRRFIPILDQLCSYVEKDKLVIRERDIMNFDFEEEFSGIVPLVRWKDDMCFLHIIGNLPFNVSLPLLVQWIKHISYHSGPFKFGRVPMTLTFQEEVGLRMVAPPSSEYRSRLSVTVQAYCSAKLAYKLPSSVFAPRPKVKAYVLHLRPLVTPNIEVRFEILDLVVRSLFNQKRSTLRKGLHLLFPDDHQLGEDLLKKAGIDTTQRVSCLTLEEINAICLECKPYIENRLQEKITQGSVFRAAY